MELSVYNPAPRLFAGFYGENGTGKTHNAIDLAMAAALSFGLDGPIAVFDTEGGAQRWHTQRVKELSGRDLLTVPPNDDGTRPRSLEALRDFLNAAGKANAAVTIVDSMTHVLEDCRHSYFARRGIDSPDASDYAPADRPFTALMKRLTDSTMNLIICAREQQQYGMYENSRGKMVNGPVGTKFGAKSAAYDFDLLVHMQSVPQKGKPDRRVMTIEKDRSRTINGQSFTFPFKVSEVFEGYLSALVGETAKAAQ